MHFSFAWGEPGNEATDSDLWPKDLWHIVWQNCVRFQVASWHLIYFPPIHTTAQASSRSDSPDTLSKPSLIKQLLSSPKSRRKKEQQQLEQEKSKPVQRYTPEAASEDLYTLPDKKLGHLAAEVGVRRREGGGKERGGWEEGRREGGGRREGERGMGGGKERGRKEEGRREGGRRREGDREEGEMERVRKERGRREGGRRDREREEGRGGGRKEGREGSEGGGRKKEGKEKGGREKGEKQGMEGVKWRKAWCKEERPNS